MVTPMADSLFVIDSTFLLEASRNSFHGAPLLQDSSGRDTTMLFGFARDLLRLRKQLGMRKALVVIGDGEPCLPDSLISDAIDFLKRLRVPALCPKGVRVGNVCAALAERCTWVVTRNKAMLQLINGRCGVIIPKKGNELDVVTVASIKDQLGVSPSQVPYLFALTEKNEHGSVLTQRQAVRFLELHGTLETVLQKAAAGDLGQVGHKLVTRSDALRQRCCELEFRAAALGEMKGRYAEAKFIEEAEAAASVLKEYGFWSLVRLLPFPERELVRGINLSAENPPRPDYRAARTQADLDELHKMVEAAEVCALDSEASDKDPRDAVLYGVAFSVKERQAVYVPLMEPDLDGVSREEVRPRLARIFRIKTKFVGHNIKFDYLILRKHGMHLRNIHFDTMLAAGECFGDWDFFNLGEVARRLLGTKIKRYRDIIEKEQTFLDVPFKDLVEHACTDADMSLRLFHRLSVELRNRQLEDNFLRDRMRMLARLAEMECEGVRIDVKKIKMSINHFLEEADALKKLILQDAGCEFDLDSRKETLDALRKVETLREWITSRSLTQSGMEQLAWRHRLVEQIVKYRRVRKRLRELDAIRNAARRGKVFPLFSQLRVPHMSATSSSPNLDEALRANAVRDAFLSQDYPSPKQALQRLQQITEDQVLRTDLTRCAQSDFRCAREPVLEGLDHAEVLLSIAVGLPDAAVCRRFLLSPEKAMRIKANLRLRYPVLFEWLDGFRRESIARGYAEHDGRRIYLEGLRSSNIEKKNTATSSAIRWLVRY
jgi:DNA polymerase I